MANYPELDQLAQTLLQVISLLFPVTFLTMRWIVDREFDSMSESQIQNTVHGFVIMIILLTVTGFSATIAIFDIPRVKPLLGFIATLSLATFFLTYRTVFILLLRSG